MAPGLVTSGEEQHAKRHAALRAPQATAIGEFPYSTRNGTSMKLTMSGARCGSTHPAGDDSTCTIVQKPPGDRLDHRLGRALLRARR